MGYEKIVLSGFPGGITDKPEDGNIFKAAELNNVVLRDNGTPITAQGVQHVSDYVYRTPNQEDCKKVIQYNNENIYFAGSKVYLDNGTSLAELSGVNVTGDVFYGVDSDNFISDFAWKNQFFLTTNKPSRPIKMYKDDTDGWKIVTAGLPEMANDPTFGVTGGTLTGEAGETISYLAGYCYMQAYTINGIDYETRGPITLVEAANQTSVSGGGTAHYSNIPVLVNTSDTHYDVDNIKVECYRTLVNGQILYLDKTIDNGVTGTTSNTTDAEIKANPRAYTEGGVLNHDAPPKCKIIVESQGYAYYLGLEDDPASGLESMANIPDAVPAGNSFQLDDEITGAGLVFDDVFVMTKNKWYRLDGHYADNGSGLVKPSIISNADGVLYHQSLDNGTHGLYGAGQKGFVFCNGEKVISVCDFDELYSQLKANSSEINQIVGSFDPINKRMFFSCKKNSYTTQNDTLYILHEKLGIKEDSSFTTWGKDKYFAPKYIQFLKDNKLFRGEAGGYLLKHDPQYKWDIQYNSTTLPTSWLKEAIRERITTVRLYGEDVSIRKWGVKLLLQLKNLTNQSIQMSCATDGSQDFKPMNKIDILNQITWGDEHIYWEAANDFYWEDAKDMLKMLRMPKGFARFYSRQLRFEKALSILYTPQWGYAASCTVNSAMRRVTFNGSVPSNILGKYMLFANNGYVEKYLIIQELSSNVFRLSDPNSTLVDGITYWEVKGYPINQLLNPLKIIMYYVNYGESFDFANQTGGKP